MLFCDLNIPEIFVTEYLCSAKGDYVKIYLYCSFLCKYGSEISALELSKKLFLPLDVVENGFKYWEEQGLLVKKQDSYSLTDIKKMEVDRLYTPKVTSSLEDALEANSKNVVRTQVIKEINSTFFQGVMSPTWYTDIDTLFSKYQFDENVMISLFQYCLDRGALHRKYLFTVAEGWASNNIKTIIDLENYYMQYEKNMQIKKSISKKLNLNRNLTQYEEAYVDKWLLDFGYSLDIIEIALKKTTSKSNVGFEYIDKIISDWHDRKLETFDSINDFLKEQKQKQKDIKTMAAIPAQPSKPSPRYTGDSDNLNYNDFSKFYANM